MKRRETERQQQWRLKSYAYISKQEADEKWTPITMNPADSNSAAVLWDRLASGPETQLPLDLSREEYLSACLPCKPSALERRTSDSRTARTASHPHRDLAHAHAPTPDTCSSAAASSRHAAGQRAAPGNADQLPHAATNGNARAGQQAGQAAEHSASANGTLRPACHPPVNLDCSGIRQGKPARSCNSPSNHALGLSGLPRLHCAGGQPMEGVEIFRGPPLSDGDARCLKQALMELFRNTPVVSLFNIRCERPPMQAHFERSFSSEGHMQILVRPQRDLASLMQRVARHCEVGPAGVPFCAAVRHGAAPRSHAAERHAADGPGLRADRYRQPRHRHVQGGEAWHRLLPNCWRFLLQDAEQAERAEFAAVICVLALFRWCSTSWQSRRV